MLLMLWLAASSQSLPASLQTVTLKIAKTQAAKGAPVYVVMAESFNPHQAARAQAIFHGEKATAINGNHMQRIARLLALDTQRVFVLPESDHMTDDEQRAALQMAGVRFLQPIRTASN